MALRQPTYTPTDMTVIALHPADSELHSPESAARSKLTSDSRFNTDHLLADLNGRSVRGGATTLAAQATKFAMQMASTAILARLLTPADFGLIAMVTAITGFAALFKDLGLAQATVQRDVITHKQVSTLFWVNVGAGLLIALVVVATAPVISWFYNEPQLLWVTIALASTFVFGGLTTQHTALLRRQMRFHRLAVIDVLSIALGVFAALLLALLGAQYWALVGMTTASSLATTVGVWLASDWTPCRPARRTGVRPMLRFGGHLTLASTANYFVRNADNVIVGACFGSGALGLYSKAYQLLSLPIAQINAPITAVVIPALSRLDCTSNQYSQYYLRAIDAIALPGLLLSTVILGLARPVVEIVLGSEWAEVAILFWCLGPAILTSVFNVAGGWVFVTSGRADRLSRWSVCTSPLVLAAMLIGSQWGPRGVALSFSTCYAVLFPFMLRYAYRGTSVRFSSVVRMLAPATIGTVVSGLATIVTLETLSSRGAYALIVGSIVYGIGYGLSLAASKSLRSQWTRCVTSCLRSMNISRNAGGDPRAI